MGCVVGRNRENGKDGGSYQMTVGVLIERIRVTTIVRSMWGDIPVATIVHSIVGTNFEMKNKVL